MYVYNIYFFNSNYNSQVTCESLLTKTKWDVTFKSHWWNWGQPSKTKHEDVNSVDTSQGPNQHPSPPSHPQSLTCCKARALRSPWGGKGCVEVVILDSLGWNLQILKNTTVAESVWKEWSASFLPRTWGGNCFHCLRLCFGGHVLAHLIVTCEVLLCECGCAFYKRRGRWGESAIGCYGVRAGDRQNASTVSWEPGVAYPSPRPAPAWMQPPSPVLPPLSLRFPSTLQESMLLNKWLYPGPGHISQSFLTSSCSPGHVLWGLSLGITSQQPPLPWWAPVTPALLS